jgi:hypothetical protein
MLHHQRDLNRDRETTMTKLVLALGAVMLLAPALAFAAPYHHHHHHMWPMHHHHHMGHPAPTDDHHGDHHP